MRRKSDTHGDSRTGRGRRSRDRLLTGEPPISEGLAPAAASSELGNQLFMLGDDVREAALCLAGIESFLVDVQSLLATDGLRQRDLAELLHRDDTATRLDELEDALAGLRRSLHRTCTELPPEPSAQPAQALGRLRAHG